MDISSLVDLDRQLLLFFNGSDSLFLDGLAKMLTTASTWIPLYVALFFAVVKNNNVQKVLLILACAGLCVFFAGSLNDMFVKSSVMRWRPSHDVVIGSVVDIVNGYRGGSYGFFSSHAANTFSIAVFFSLLMRNHILTVALICWSIINCWTRLYLGVHFPGDILCGLIWGGIVGVSLWLLYDLICRRLMTPNQFISTQYTSSGYLIADIDVIISVLAFSCLYAILRACFFLYV